MSERVVIKKTGHNTKTFQNEKFNNVGKVNKVPMDNDIKNKHSASAITWSLFRHLKKCQNRKKYRTISAYMFSIPHKPCFLNSLRTREANRTWQKDLHITREKTQKNLNKDWKSFSNAECHLLAYISLARSSRHEYQKLTAKPGLWEEKALHVLGTS